MSASSSPIKNHSPVESSKMDGSGLATLLGSDDAAEAAAPFGTEGLEMTAAFIGEGFSATGAVAKVTARAIADKSASSGAACSASISDLTPIASACGDGGAGWESR